MELRCMLFPMAFRSSKVRMEWSTISFETSLLCWMLLQESSEHKRPCRRLIVDPQ